MIMVRVLDWSDCCPVVLLYCFSHKFAWYGYGRCQRGICLLGYVIKVSGFQETFSQSVFVSELLEGMFLQRVFLDSGRTRRRETRVGVHERVQTNRYVYDVKGPPRQTESHGSAQGPPCGPGRMEAPSLCVQGPPRRTSYTEAPKGPRVDRVAWKRPV